MTWKQGRRLDTVSQNGMLVSSYKYNDEGIRTSKIECGVEHKYILDGTRIISETWGDVLIVYLYDEAGSPIGMQYRHKNMPEGTFDSFFFEKNIFGDIIAIYDTSGVKQISYTYDAFGKFTKTIHVSGTRADFNYLRYRGYYYDAETGFYYLNSRYYDPVTCRFINADGYVSTGQGLTGYNMFAYCGNNPVMYVDPSGEIWDWISLGYSAYELCEDPTDIENWINFGFDALDAFVPILSGTGELYRAYRVTDKVIDTIDAVHDTYKIADNIDDAVEIAQATDLTRKAKKIIKTLDKSGGYTKSTLSAGKEIHKGYKTGKKFNKSWKEYSKIKGIRPDYVDFGTKTIDTKTIYELKPNNPKSIAAGIKQLRKYNKALGGGFKLVLEVY